MKHLFASFALVLILGAVSVVMADPDVRAAGAEGPQQQVQVNGEVRNPGLFDWQSGMTVQAGLDAAGGPTDKFSLARSYILRNQTGEDGRPVRSKISRLKAGTMLLAGDTLVAGKRLE